MKRANVNWKCIKILARSLVEMRLMGKWLRFVVNILKQVNHLLIYLGSYEGKKLENTVETLQGYALAQKEKKDLSECVCITHKMIFSSCQSQR